MMQEGAIPKENQEQSAEPSIERTLAAMSSNDGGNDEGIDTPSALCDKYRFVRFLGKGTQGRVYEAERLSDGEHVAIKVLDIHSIQNWKEYDLFWREAKTLQALHVDGVARFYEAMEDLNSEHPCAYLVQQYIHGRPLSDMLRDGTHFGMTDIFSFAVQIVEILRRIHRHDPPIIHRDIKPSNLMLEPDGASYRVYLTDFGAVCNPMVQRGGSTVAGTFGYMPPEQLMGNVSMASDIYALGVTLVELLSGVSPADMEIADLRLVIEKPLANAPYSVVSLLRRMTMPDVDARLCDHDVLLKRFRAFARGEFSEESKMVPLQEEYAHDLTSVDRLGGKENLSLWLALPEQTPRAIPGCYQKLRPYRESVFWNSTFKPNLVVFLHPLNLFRVPWQYLCACLWVILCVLLEILFFCTDVVTFLFRAGENKELEAQWNREAFYIRELLERGRKSMATVVRVEYMGKNSEARTSPLFKVRYAFNPPDDSLASDLIHEIVVCNEPHLSPGDSLPILYLIENSLLGVESVYSMPFPLPVKTLAELASCYCMTRDGIIHRPKTGKSE